MAFLASIGSAFFYFLGAKQTTMPPAPSKTGLRSYYVMLAAGFLATVLLFSALLSHQFEYSYVAKYTSSTQPLLYLISAFWAGQEGTFLLWALLVSAMGFVFIRTSQQEDGYAMSVVSAFIAFLYLLTIIKSPFELSKSVPPDGEGMNPLLQNPWMVIHPPILFIGYAASVFPFALIVSGLARREYTRWNASGFAWTVFASLTLGAGIIIGGFWAYEVLGWGGFWGWDPVENSSLVPWLALLALIHGFLVQRAKGSLVRTNMFLAICTFLLVLYATFLTRSGVLADFSVHSFVDLGISSYLIGVMVVSTALGLGLFATRFGGIQSPKISFSSLNREVTLLLSLFVLMAAAIFTFVGMSSPIITGLFGKASQVDTSFYSKVNFPVAIGVALLLGVTPFLGWAEEGKSGLLKKISMSLALTALSCAIAYVAGVTTFSLMLFVGSAAFGLISNVIVAFRQYKSGWMNLGGPVAHIGVGLFLIGIIGSGRFDQVSRLVLKQGEPQSVFGYQILFKGMSDMHAVKPLINLEISDGRTTYAATPKLYFSEYNQGMMREPDIKIYPLHDLYISPLEVKSPVADHTNNTTYELTKGETKEIGGYQVTFSRFDMAQHGQPGAMSVGAVLSVGVAGKTQEVVPQLVFDQTGQRKIVPVDLPAISAAATGSVPQIALDAISVEEKKVLLEFFGPGNQPTALPELVVEISTKPLMMVVWTGVVLIVLGSAVAFKRRASKEPVS
jgi:cytochrome c-type biogenesis protein CcmF